MVSNRLCIGVSKMQSSLSRLFRSREMDSLGDSAFSVARAHGELPALEAAPSRAPGSSSRAVPFSPRVCAAPSLFPRAAALLLPSPICAASFSHRAGAPPPSSPQRRRRVVLPATGYSGRDIPSFLELPCRPFFPGAAAPPPPNFCVGKFSLQIQCSYVKPTEFQSIA